ncbi:hypothetical protein GGS20DRAFT_599301 [Poronia punctata]|nr:hypothetical protein GGS20DRAFT_599301 [Poronia punctata]
MNMDTFESVFHEKGRLRRLFAHSSEMLYKDVPVSDLVIYNPTKQISHLRSRHPITKELEVNTMSLVIYFGAYYSPKKKNPPNVGWSVYVGPESCHNASGKLPLDAIQTRRRGCIEALSHALDIMKIITSQDDDLVFIVFVSDTLGMVNAMARWMENWEGYALDRVELLTDYFEGYKELDKRILELENNGNGFIVKFWYYPAAEVYNLARDALYQEGIWLAS